MTEEALLFINWDEAAKYRKKIKGFISPFNTVDKSENVRKDNKNKKYKFKPKEDIKIIKEKVKILKKSRVAAKEREKENENKLYQKHRNIMKNLHHKLMREKGEHIEGEVPMYQARNNSQIYDISQSQPALKLYPNQRDNTLKGSHSKKYNKLPNKFTIDSLMKLKYNDIAGSGPDGFNPADILDSDSGSEDSVLNQYRDIEEQVPVNQSISQQNYPQDAYMYNGIKSTERAVPMDHQNSMVSHQKTNLKRKGGHNNSIVEKERFLNQKHIKSSNILPKKSKFRISDPITIRSRKYWKYKKKARIFQKERNYNRWW